MPTTPSSKIALPLMLLVAATAPAAAAGARALADVDVYDRSDGIALETYRHRGKRYIEGRPGNLYAIRIRNRTGSRVLAVVSVDGVNVLSGATAAPDQSGYVIEAGGYVTIPGWRKDLDRTAAFYFSDPAASYASRTGRPHDLGVIGVALFRERETSAVAHGHAARESAKASEARSARAPAAVDAHAAGIEAQSARSRRGPGLGGPTLGTGHGESEYDPVREVAFERASSHPEQVVTLRYERRDALVALGVLPRERQDARDPDPFPGALSFVPDP